MVGDSIGGTEGVVLEVMRKFKTGEVPEEMKGVKFVEFLPFMGMLMAGNHNNKSNLCEVLRRKLGEDSGNGGRGGGGGGAVVYVGDLKWVVERDSKEVDGLIGEIERLLVGGFDDHNPKNKVKIWVMGVVTYQNYMRCQMRQPPLETQWDLHVLPVPSSSSLALSFHASRYHSSLSLSLSLSLSYHSIFVCSSSKVFCHVTTVSLNHFSSCLLGLKSYSKVFVGLEFCMENLHNHHVFEVSVENYWEGVMVEAHH